MLDKNEAGAVLGIIGIRPEGLNDVGGDDAFGIRPKGDVPGGGPASGMLADPALEVIGVGDEGA